MSIFARLAMMIRQVLGRVIPYRSIESVERVDTPLSTDMTNALTLWYDLYRNRAPWVDKETVKSMNLPAMIASEIARQIVLELKWEITGGDGQKSERAEYLKAEFEKLVSILRLKLEQGCAAGGMIIKPYPNQDDGHIYFDWAMDWGFYPLAFDDDGNLSDVIIPDVYQDGDITFTRLERHKLVKGGVEITQRAFRSERRDTLGTEIDLSSVERWASLNPEVKVTDSDGALFGWFKVAAANTVDTECPLGASVFAKAVDVIREADKQYSRLLWEYEGSELAVDVDPVALRPKKNNMTGRWESPKLNERLFRAVDASTGDRDMYHVFAPPIRDASLINGLNSIMRQIEDLCGLSRGTISDPNMEARTATEMKIVRQRSYQTIADNQRALEHCLKDVVRTMDKYATLYNLAPEGDYEVSFTWDDSIVTDTSEQMQEYLSLLNSGIISRAEFRQWYFGETEDQATAAIDAITQAAVAAQMAAQAATPAQQGGEQEDET